MSATFLIKILFQLPRRKKAKGMAAASDNDIYDSKQWIAYYIDILQPGEQEGFVKTAYRSYMLSKREGATDSPLINDDMDRQMASLFGRHTASSILSLVCSCCRSAATGDPNCYKAAPREGDYRMCKDHSASTELVDYVLRVYPLCDSPLCRKKQRDAHRKCSLELIEELPPEKRVVTKPAKLMFRKVCDNCKKTQHTIKVIDSRSFVFMLFCRCVVRASSLNTVRRGAKELRGLHIKTCASRRLRL